MSTQSPELSGGTWKWWKDRIHYSPKYFERGKMKIKHYYQEFHSPFEPTKYSVGLKFNRKNMAFAIGFKDKISAKRFCKDIEKATIMKG